MSARHVHVYVASFNTRAATELCIRTMRETAGIPFDLTVGDSGSYDGSQEMLRMLAERGWLNLEVRPRRQHADWLDDWIRRGDPGYVVFSDSDIQYLGRGWLADLVTTADTAEAAVVYAEGAAEWEAFVDPSTGEVVRLAARPGIWLVLVNAQKVRSVDVSFHKRHESREDLAEGKMVYDVGGWFFRAVELEGMAVVQMPKRFRRSFRHYVGLSWVYGDSDYGRRKALDRRVIERRLRYVALRQEGSRASAAILRTSTELGAALSYTILKTRKLRHPMAVLERVIAVSDLNRR